MVSGQSVAGDWYLEIASISQPFRDLYKIKDEEIEDYAGSVARKLRMHGPYLALLDYMRRTGQTWEEIAPKSHFSPGRVSRWKRGEEKPSPESIQKIKRI